MKPQPGDISIVDKTGTFLLWYDTLLTTLMTSLRCRGTIDWVKLDELPYQ